jgi:hypothetical protein
MYEVKFKNKTSFKIILPCSDGYHILTYNPF